MVENRAKEFQSFANLNDYLSITMFVQSWNIQRGGNNYNYRKASQEPGLKPAYLLQGYNCAVVVTLPFSLSQFLKKETKCRNYVATLFSPLSLNRCLSFPLVFIFHSMIYIAPKYMGRGVKRLHIVEKPNFSSKKLSRCR